MPTTADGGVRADDALVLDQHAHCHPGDTPGPVDPHASPHELRRVAIVGQAEVDRGHPQRLQSSRVDVRCPAEEARVLSAVARSGFPQGLGQGWVEALNRRLRRSPHQALEILGDLGKGRPAEG